MTTNQNYNNNKNTYRIISPLTDDIQEVSSPFTFQPEIKPKTAIKTLRNVLRNGLKYVYS